MIRIPIPFLILSSAALAQGTAPPRVATSFVPPDHRCEVVIDVAALLESGLMDDLQGAPMGKMMLGQAEEGLGFPLSALKKVRLYPEVPGSGREPGRRNGGLAILEGGPEVKMPMPEDAEKQKLAGFDVVADSGRENPDLWVDVAPGLLLYGTKHLVEPLLDGSAKAAATNPKLAAIAAGEGVVLHAAALLDPAMFGRQSPFASGEVALPEVGAVRLRTEAGEDDEPQFVLEVIARYGADETDEAGEKGGEKGASGPEALIAMVQAQLEGMAKAPMMASLKPLLAKLECKADGRDARMALRLGSSRDVANAIGQLAPMLMLGGAAAEPVGR